MFAAFVVQGSVTCLCGAFWPGLLWTPDLIFFGFLDVVREYRKVDDGITMRMNRNGALFRDRTREGRSLSGSEEESCAYFWKELVGALV